MIIRYLSILAACALLALATAAPTLAQETPEEYPVVRGAAVSAPVTPFVFDGDVRDLPAPAHWQPGDPIKEIPRRFYPPPGSEAQYEGQSVGMIDPLLEVQENASAMTSAAFTAPSRNFPGQGFTGVNPPDTVGDVGPNYYIQSINSGGGADVQIWDKAEPTPSVVASFRMDNLGSGSCGSGLGDPIVLYDRLAGRWLLSEFSSSGNNLCVYISQTADPVTGGWFNYGFQAPSFPDYPKYGVWPTDANGGQGSYIVTANDGGPGIYALNRGAMLSGSPGTYQRMTIPGLPGFGFESPTPADLDGPTPPPTGAPAIIMRHRDTENHNGPAAPGDLLEYWSFEVDWTSPSSTTLAQETSVDVSEFDSDLCGLSSFFCFPQPNSSTTLDPLREVIMNRLQYINHGDFETLVGNLVTDVNGSNHGGVRWFELRGGAKNWTLHQEGTYAPDADHRWMAASSMDQSQNIAIAYSVSSNSTFPSLRYTGRLADDPLGAMTQPETAIHDGTSPNSSNRWGDYAAMNLDPVDDCTFWFTSMDNLTSSWRTQIASLAFDACGCELEPSALTVNAAVTGDNEIEVSWGDSDLSTVIEYNIGRSFTQGGPYETIATITDTSQGIAGGPDYFFTDTDVSGGSTYFYVIRATDGLACTSADSNEASATATGQCTLAPAFAGLASATTPYDAICTVDLAWNAAADSCGGPIVYNIYRSTIPDFAPSPLNLLVPGVNTTSFSDTIILDNGVSYYYVVRALDQANGVLDANTVELEAIPEGELTTGTWLEDGGDTGMAKMAMETPWSLNASEGNLGPAVYKTGSYGNLICSGLTTPPLQLGAGAQLTFASKYAIESSWDKGEVQISTDGENWERVALAYPGNSTNTSDQCGFPTGSYFTGTNLTWNDYVANLSGWSGQVVQLRFALSTDTSQNGQGWWVDDISITQVDVPGVCTPGNFCLENPFVDVVPNGQSTVCLGDEQLLTASLTGGTGPFNYQWTRDGVDIPGANGETLAVNDAGFHIYNCKVRSDLCTDHVFDLVNTGITWLGAPTFDGVQSVTNPELGTCTLDVAWDAATGVCPGPISYSVYRDTSSPVDTTAENLVASGLSGTSYADAADIVENSEYFYLVRAVEESNGIADANVVEASGIATGPNGGGQIAFQGNFNGPTGFRGWTVTNGPGPHDCGDWKHAISSAQAPSGGSGWYALADSNACGPGSNTSTRLRSKAIDLSIPGLGAVLLDYDLFYNHVNGDDATVEVWNGSAWQVVWSDGNVDVNGHQMIDVTAQAVGVPNFLVRFNYQNAANDGWFAVDNVVVTALTPCETASTSTAPPPVPDGAIATTPLIGSRATFDGAVIDVTWDATSCPAVDYNLIYGDLADVAVSAVSGAECAVGTSGSFTWTSVPAGDLFFLMVGTDGAGAESSWGTMSGFVERNGSAASGECSVTAKDLTESCP